MPERIFIGVAWPTPNGPLHLGHLAGCYLPADIFARYHRLAGNEVLMVSGSDQHGTPVTIRAEADGTTPAEVAARFHRSFLDTWAGLGIDVDLFTTTGTATHRRVVHDLFRRLWAGRYLRRGTMTVLWCDRCARALADRYAEGTCPHCGAPGARGDQCGTCGRPLDAVELVDPRCRRCGGTPAPRQTEHVFLRLGAFEDTLRAWVEAHTDWRPNVRGTAHAWLDAGLRERAITRDLEWGIPVPLDGYAGKRIYVWFEAVIGYLSASVEWAERRGEPEAWRVFWTEPTRHYYFVGKDNIPFHTIIWPAILLGAGGLKLPDDVPANEFLTLAGEPFSTSRGHAIWLPDYLARYDPDPLRFALALNLPETGDADFTWAGFIAANNDSLLATWGNLVHRTLSLVHRSFGGRLPDLACSPGQRPGDAALRAEAHGGDAGRRELGSRPGDAALLAAAQSTLERCGAAIERCHFREALRTALVCARETNRYLDAEQPWHVLAHARAAASPDADTAAAAATLATALSAIDTLKVALAPFLPHTCERLHRLLGWPDTIADQGWRMRPLPPLAGSAGASATSGPGAAATLEGPPPPLFRKLDPAVDLAPYPAALPA